MARSPTTPERAALIAAHEARVAARAALAAAEDAHRLAQRDLDGAQGDIMDLEAQIGRLKSTRTHQVPDLLEAVNQKLSICYSKQDNAQRTIGPFGVAAHASKARLDAASFPVSNADIHIARAARHVAAVEAEPAARAALDRLHEAFDIILRVGPDLMTMRNVLSPDLVSEIETAAGGLLPRATGWVEFEARRKASPWRGAVERLSADPTAALPQAPTS
jgi:hypothetical protein